MKYSKQTQNFHLRIKKKLTEIKSGTRTHWPAKFKNYVFIELLLSSSAHCINYHLMDIFLRFHGVSFRYNDMDPIVCKSNIRQTTPQFCAKIG